MGLNHGDRNNSNTLFKSNECLAEKRPLWAWLSLTKHVKRKKENLFYNLRTWFEFLIILSRQLWRWLAMKPEMFLNLLNPERVFFQNFSFLVFFYMITIFFTSNLITDTVRRYRRSLPYLRINIILILNCSLVEVDNAVVSITVWIAKHVCIRLHGLEF